jgi:fimbrial chaperone protein
MKIGKVSKIVLTLAVVLGLSSFAVFRPSVATAQVSYTVVPVGAKLSPSGSGSHMPFLVRNDSNQPVALEISFTKRQVDIDGNETELEADEDFIAYPPQLLLMPGQTQTVRVSWLGDPLPTEELAYWMTTQQVPVDLGNENENDSDFVAQVKEGINVSFSALINYKGAIYITPPNTIANIVVIDVSHKKGEDGKDQLVLLLENQGTAHLLIREPQLTLKSQSGQELVLSTEKLDDLQRKTILPATKRRFILPWPKELPVGPVTATFTTN